jgi:hypothetical protein
MSVLTGTRRWAGRNLVPLVLIPLAALFLWVGIWRVWLPPAGSGAVVVRAVTTVDANAATRPTHRITSVVKTTRGGSPSRRSEALALVLLALGAGAAVIAVFHDRIGSLELGKDGVKINLTATEQAGAATLVGRLAAAGASPALYARGVGRYLRAVAARRAGSPVVGAVAPELGAKQADELARRIADELV